MNKKPSAIRLSTSIYIHTYSYRWIEKAGAGLPIVKSPPPPVTIRRIIYILYTVQSEHTPRALPLLKNSPLFCWLLLFFYLFYFVICYVSVCSPSISERNNLPSSPSLLLLSLSSDYLRLRRWVPTPNLSIGLLLFFSVGLKGHQLFFCCKKK